MISMPRRPTRDDISKAPSRVREYLRKIETLAKEGLIVKNMVSSSVRVGKITLGKTKKINVPIIVKLSRGNNAAKKHPIDEVFIDGKQVLDPTDKAVTDNNSEWSHTFTLLATEQITVRVGLKADGNINYSSSVLEMNVPKAKTADQLRVVIPGLDNLNVDKLDANGFITAKIFTSYKGNGLSAEVEVLSEPFTFGSNLHKLTEINHSISVSTEDDGHLTISLKPSKDGQDFFISLKGTDKIFKISYQKKEDPIPDTLNLVIPGLDDNGVTYEKTTDNGFLVNLELLKEKKRVKTEVRIYSQSDFLYAVDGARSALKKEHVIAIDGMKTLIIYTREDWQKITFTAAGVEPRTIEFRKEI